MNRKRLKWTVALLFGLLMILGCGLTSSDSDEATSAPSTTDDVTVAPEEDTPAPLPSVDSATAAPDEAATTPSDSADSTAATDPVRSLTILYTNDEHGWMEGVEPEANAANLTGLMREREGLGTDENVILLSGGDMWTGPAISTLFLGASMVEVMNGMGYAAAAIGNHEFDFGLDTLQAHAAQSTFPFVSANIRYADGSTPTDLGIQPFVIIERNGVQIGIIGLTTTRTPTTTKPDNVADFEFLSYDEALRDVVPQARAAGAELILVPGHVCERELEFLAHQVDDLGIHLLGGGHCNERFAREIGDTILLGGGGNLSGYAVARLRFDTESDTIVESDLDYQSNRGGSPDPTVAEIVAEWQEEASAELDVVIGYSDNGIARRSPEMQALTVESWLIAYPSADIALTNLGGMRADFPPGDITIADVIGVMPFDNVIIEVLLTGEQLETTMRGREDNTAVAGMVWRGGNWILTDTGQPLDPDEVYSVLVNDFMYAGGDGYRFAEFDPLGYDTSLNWRQPVIDWIMAQNSSPSNPLDSAIDLLVD